MRQRFDHMFMRRAWIMALLLCLAACKKDASTPDSGAAAPPPPPGPATGGGGAWKCGDKVCSFDQGEDCMVCPKDCKVCDGCQVKVGEGCPDCKCERCVCKKLPECCKRGKSWTQKCVDACKKSCGGCKRIKNRAIMGAPGKAKPGTAKPVGAAVPTQRTGSAKTGVPKTLAATCGNGNCELALGEDCETCAKDCSRCNGCLPKLGPGCVGCKCAACVCKKLPECCAAKGRWSITCVDACREKCGGCGVTAAAPPVKTASPAPAAGATASVARCGDGKCDAASEDCNLCPKDCGDCNGCQAKLGPSCINCKCQACVCKKRPSCCKAGGLWDKTCAALCKKDCGGCGLNK